MFFACHPTLFQQEKSMVLQDMFIWWWCFSWLHTAVSLRSSILHLLLNLATNHGLLRRHFVIAPGLV